MGLFSKSGTCNVCHESIGQEVKDGFVCKKCMRQAGIFIYPKGMPKELCVDNYIGAVTKSQENQKRFLIFSATNAVEKFKIDQENKMWCLADGFAGDKDNPIVFDFSDLISYEFVEGNTIVTKGGLGSAVAGGALFGGVGAIVGGVTGSKTKEVVRDVYIKINTKKKECNLVTVYINRGTEFKKGSFTYNNIMKIADITIALLELIISEQNQMEGVKEQMKYQSCPLLTNYLN